MLRGPSHRDGMSGGAITAGENEASDSVFDSSNDESVRI